MKIPLVDCTGTLLREIAMPEATRDSLAVTYALAIASLEATDWPVVNRAIMERWSVSALEYIKRAAWKRIQGAAGRRPAWERKVKT